MKCKRLSPAGSCTSRLRMHHSGGSMPLSLRPCVSLVPRRRFANQCSKWQNLSERLKKESCDFLPKTMIRDRGSRPVRTRFTHPDLYRDVSKRLSLRSKTHTVALVDALNYVNTPEHEISDGKRARSQNVEIRVLGVCLHKFVCGWE